MKRNTQKKIPGGSGRVPVAMSILWEAQKGVEIKAWNEAGVLEGKDSSDRWASLQHAPNSMKKCH